VLFDRRAVLTSHFSTRPSASATSKAVGQGHQIVATVGRDRVHLHDFRLTDVHGEVVRGIPA
jgi:hypothetical protein